MKSAITLILLCTASYAQKSEDINQFLDAWHRAAAEANAAAYFGAIAEDGIYIGTDASERWDKPSFLKFSKPYFDRGKAWNFIPYDRHVQMSEDGQTAWFSELLKTWMGVCRGSGVLQKKGNGWQIKQYHLSVTVPNNVIKDFIELIESEK